MVKTPETRVRLKLKHLLRELRDEVEKETGRRPSEAVVVDHAIAALHAVKTGRAWLGDVNRIVAVLNDTLQRQRVNDLHVFAAAVGAEIDVDLSVNGDVEIRVRRGEDEGVGFRLPAQTFSPATLRPDLAAALH